MGGAVSSGETNDELVDNLLEADYIKSPLVETIFRAVDRAFYYTKGNRQNPYKDLAWKDGNLHLSAPCIYSEVLENLDLRPGLSFLNIGSGTGYLSSMAGLILGRGGINHGIELHPDVVEYARYKLERFKQSSHSVDLFEFCEPSFVVGNCMDALPVPHRYDRIYCGAACPKEFLQVIIDSLKIDGILVVPISDSLVQMTRRSETHVKEKTLLSVSFASLVEVEASKKMQNSIPLPEWCPLTLRDMCRAVIRESVRHNCRETITELEQKKAVEKLQKEKNKPKQKGRGRGRSRNSRGHSRACVIGHRVNGEGDPERGILSIAYALRNESPDSEDDSLYHAHEHEDEDSSMNMVTDSNDEDSHCDLHHPLRSRSKSSDSSTESTSSSKKLKGNENDSPKTSSAEATATPTTTTTTAAVDLSVCSGSETGTGSGSLPGTAESGPLFKSTDTDNENGTSANGLVAKGSEAEDIKDSDKAGDSFKSQFPPSHPIPIPTPIPPPPPAHASSRVRFLRQAESTDMDLEEGLARARAEMRFKEEVSRRLRDLEPKRKVCSPSAIPTTTTSASSTSTSTLTSQSADHPEPKETTFVQKASENDQNQSLTAGSDANISSDIEKMDEVENEPITPSPTPYSNTNQNHTTSSTVQDQDSTLDTLEGRPPYDNDNSVEMEGNDSDHQEGPEPVPVRVQGDNDIVGDAEGRPPSPPVRRRNSSPTVEQMVFVNVPVDASEDEEDEEETNSDSEWEDHSDGHEGEPGPGPERRRPRHRPSRRGHPERAEPRVAVLRLGPRGNSLSPTPPSDLSAEYVEEPPREITHPLTVQMRDKIKTLPLPPAVKLYLNYNRNL